MKKPNITEGEWEYYEKSTGYPVVRLVRTLTDINQMCYSSQSKEVEKSSSEARANARAISAVPDMIYALMDTLEILKSLDQEDEDIYNTTMIVDEALTKAGCTDD